MTQLPRHCVRLAAVCSLSLAVLGCGGGSKPATTAPTESSSGTMDTKMMEGMHMTADDGSTFGPLDVGADWVSYTKLSSSPFRSETHGNRMVEVYVNATGLDAYKAGTVLPVGSIVVKTSQQDDGSAGPIFVMEKRAAGYNPEHGDYYFAIRWEDPPEKWRKRLGGPIYWRTPSRKAGYCSECHDNYDDQDFMGGIPDGHRTW